MCKASCNKYKSCAFMFIFYITGELCRNMWFLASNLLILQIASTCVLIKVVLLIYLYVFGDRLVQIINTRKSVGLIIIFNVFNYSSQCCGDCGSLCSKPIIYLSNGDGRKRHCSLWRWHRGKRNNCVCWLHWCHQSYH